MKVRVYKPAKNAMQSGQAATKHWVMEFEPGAKKVADQLVGWIGSTDTRGQVRMYFETLEEAQAFATKHKLIADIEQPKPRKLQIKSYAENFAFKRVV
ncbi:MULTISPECIES: ETC complex I subunit [Thalassospira]|uniref:ETC complex subunit I n=2 Tax=Thalassospira TaxID=168934 RepID=A0A367W5W7_9PROT|nr:MULTISPECIES: ETC complex I subunit [Thalassospira]MDG4719380.1 ETC complex I subunit [Thalassospira sp. FZY0004]RCK36787.1 ETC complex subunit I [Thalassospira profundimaris]